MADWSVSHVEPGKKVYLFIGPAGNALDVLVRQATEGVDHVVSLRTPLSVTSLSTTLGTPEESQTTIIRSIEDLTEDDWALVSKYLQPMKVKGQSLILVGADMPSAPKSLKEKIKRQGQLVDVSSPTGEVGRKNLEFWVEKTWKTSPQAAHLACQRAEYSVEHLVWAWRSWSAVTQGKGVTGSLALKLVEALILVPPTESLYRTLLERRPVTGVRLHPDEALGLFKALESALSDLQLMSPVLNTGASLKTVASKTGIHLFRVMDLAPMVARYPPAAVAKCRQSLAFGFAHHREPEVGSMVATLWG